MTMKVKLRARLLWNAVDKGTDNEEDDRHGGGTRVSSRIRGRLLANLLLPCVNTAREGGAEKAPCCDTVAAAGAGAARLTCSTVGTCSGRRRVSPVSVI